MARTVETGIEITGRDVNATQVMRSAGAEAKTLKTQFAGVADASKDLPSQFGKMAAAMSLMSSATGQMGGKVADAGAKIADLALLMAIGGPLGIGIAAITAAIAAGSFVYERYTRAARRTEEAIRAVGEQTRATLVEVSDLNKELENFGKATLQIEIDQLKASITAKKESVRVGEEFRAQIKKLGAGSKALNKWVSQHTGLLRQDTNATFKATLATFKSLQADEKKLAALQALVTKQDEETKAVERKTRVATEHNAWAVQFAATRARERVESKAAIEAEMAFFAAAREFEASIEAQALAERESRLDAFVARRAAMRDRDVELHVAAAVKRAQANQESADAQIAASKAVAAQFSQAVVGLIQAGAQGEEALKAFAIQQITTYALTAAARGMESAIEQVGMPYGLVLGAAFAAAALGATLAYSQQLAHGGFVQGGVPGRDSVAVSATPGEYVASTGEVGGFIRFASRLLGDQQGRELADMAGMRPGGAAPSNERQTEARNRRGGGITLVNNNQIMFPDTTAMMRATREQAKTVGKLQRRGMYA